MAEVYLVVVKCTNCGWEEGREIVKGAKIKQVVCGKCGCACLKRVSK